MKRSILFMMAVSAIAVLSCTKEINNETAPEKDKVTMSFDATLAAPTKVELGASTDDGYKVMWSSGDAISVFADDAAKTSGYTNGTEFTTDLTAPNATATFTGETEVVADYYAAIPYCSNHRWYYDDEYLSLDFFTVQTANGLNSGLAFAKAVNGELQFKHVTGYIKFTIPAVYTDIKQVSVKGNDNETIGGNYVSVYQDGTTEVSDNNAILELSLVPDGEVFEPGVYYIAAVPAELNDGLTITFTNSDNEVATKTSSAALEIKAGDIVNLGTVANLNFEAQNIQAVTVEAFLDLTESSTKYQLTGIISNIANTQYGNFDLTDASGTIYVYGLTATPVASNDKSFSSLGLKEGDEVTIVGTRTSYNSVPQVGGPAYYVSHKACVAAPVISCEDNTVTITAEAGATVYYTTDGTDPVISSTRQTYSAPFAITKNVTVKVYAVATGKPQSVVVTESCFYREAGAGEYKNETLDLSAQGYTNSQEVSSTSGTVISVAFDKGTNSNTPKYYNTGTAVRVYGGGFFTVTADGKTITNITVTYDKNGSNEITVDTGNVDDDGLESIWSGEAASVKFSVGGTSGHRRIQKVEVTYID